MFSWYRSLNNLADISKWDIKSVTNMSRMFHDCNSLKNISVISNWDTKNVTNMNGMFDGCGIKKIPKNLLNK